MLVGKALRRILANPFGKVRGAVEATREVAFPRSGHGDWELCVLIREGVERNPPLGRKERDSCGFWVFDRRKEFRRESPRGKAFAALGYGVGLLTICAAAPAAHAQNLAPTRTIVVGGVQPGTAEPTGATPARGGDPAQAARQDASQGAPEPAIQLVYPPKPAEQTGPPLTLTLADALQRAQKYNAEYLAAIADQKSAQEDRLQARNARLPQLSD